MDIVFEQLTDLFCAIAPLHYSEGFDNCGLQIGNAKKPVRRVLVALDVTLSVAEYAVAQGYDAIIAHHPILLSPLRNIRWDDPKGRILLTLARGDVAVFSGHTNYDHAAQGTAYCLAQKLGLPLLPAVGDPPAIARFAPLQPAMTVEELCALLRKKLHTPVRLSPAAAPDAPISLLCIATGSGASCVPDAIAAGAQVLLTGEAKYNVAQDCVQQGITVIEAGHYETEMPAMEQLCRTLQTQADMLQYNVRLDIYAPSTSPYAW